jgi:hypothetical protein
MPLPALIAVLFAGSLGLLALGAAGRNERSVEIVRFTFQPPIYPERTSLRARYPDSRPQAVVPSIQEIQFPDGWQVEHLPTLEALTVQTVQLQHRLLPFMQQAVLQQLPVFAYSVRSPAGANMASAVIAFDPTGCYKIVHVQGPAGRAPTPAATRCVEHLAIALNGGSLILA